MPEDHDQFARIGAEEQNLEHPQAASEQTAFERELDQAEPDVIAHLAGHDPSPSRREAAFQRLCPCITNIAQGIRQRFRNAAAVQDLVEDAPRVLWEKISAYDQQRGQFAPWCKRVLYHAAISRVRGSEGGDPGMQREHPEPEAEPETIAPDAEPLWLLLLRQRDKLDRIRWEPRDTARNVHYFAVLLVHLRLSLARKVAGTIEHQDRSEFIAWCLPWRSDEEVLAFKVAWPTLLTIWEAFRQPLGQPPNWLDVGQVCALINELLSGREDSLSADVWNAWAKRAKQNARERINDEGVWQELFGWLLEDRVRTRRPERSGEGQP